ncbi:hypothetical protein Fcan01_24256 [Folsomia candida]|uniref:Uncharacterized protein n=1 Tax=Folsomia candida TaxID=158441 RepID=A0A226D6Q5_FOLCA|nr:hypothetical protein Fcan01_24256 [Folsomia candida]
MDSQSQFTPSAPLTEDPTPKKAKTLEEWVGGGISEDGATLPMNDVECVEWKEKSFFEGDGVVKFGDISLKFQYDKRRENWFLYLQQLRRSAPTHWGNAFMILFIFCEVIRACKLVTDCIVCIQQPDAACVFALLDRVGPTCIPKAESMGTHVNLAYRSERRCKQYLRGMTCWQKESHYHLIQKKVVSSLKSVMPLLEATPRHLLKFSNPPPHFCVTTEIAVENVPTIPISTEVIFVSTMPPTAMTTTAAAASQLPATTETAVENPPTVPITKEFILMGTTPPTAEMTTAAAASPLLATIPLSGNTNIPMVNINIPPCASTEMTNTTPPIFDHKIL